MYILGQVLLALSNLSVGKDELIDLVLQEHLGSEFWIPDSGSVSAGDFI